MGGHRQAILVEGESLQSLQLRQFNKQRPAQQSTASPSSKTVSVATAPRVGPRLVSATRNSRWASCRHVPAPDRDWRPLPTRGLPLRSRYSSNSAERIQTLIFGCFNSPSVPTIAASSIGIPSPVGIHASLHFLMPLCSLDEHSVSYPASRRRVDPDRLTGQYVPRLWLHEVE